jgi:hypothetical protein
MIYFGFAMALLRLIDMARRDEKRRGMSLKAKQAVESSFLYEHHLTALIK